MKQAGEATRAALKLIYWTLFCLLALALAGVLAVLFGKVIVPAVSVLFFLWVIFALFCFYFFRDPEADVPAAAQAVVAPAQGTVDVIDEVDEPTFMGGRCRRVSVFLSVFDVHVQRAPVAGRIALCKRTAGQFLNAMRTDSADFNENVLIGFASSERPGENIGVRLIAGVIARRIMPWVAEGDSVARGERISLIQFGSRCELYLPLSASVQVNLGQHVKAGETVMATRP
jgi:phosphatidylserine decarboxylase